ncbi:hypothetical protein AQ621_13530 [Marinobacter sp. P4B1]|nr:hypothetical protein AQ621_13530 [Marinobacter sp. P4B1]
MLPNKYVIYFITNGHDGSNHFMPKCYRKLYAPFPKIEFATLAKAVITLVHMDVAVAYATKIYFE